MSLEEAASRRAGEGRPVHEGETIQVQGQVAALAPVPGDRALVSLTDSAGSCLLLDGPEFMFERVTAGDRLDVRGVIASREGMVVLRPVQITTAGRSTPPALAVRTIAGLQSPQSAGTPASVEGRVTSLGETAESEYIVLEGGTGAPYPVHLSHRGEAPSLNRFHIGDHVRAVGIAAAIAGPSGQTEYRMWIGRSDAVTLLHRGWLVAPHVIFTSALAVILALLWRARRRVLTQQRHLTIRRLNGVAEDLVSAASPEELARKLAAALPGVLDPSTVRLFRFERSSQRLEPVEDESKGVPAAEESAVTLAFRNRVPLVIADARRSRLLKGSGGMIVVPIQARDELAGVLSLTSARRIRVPAAEELAALQHVGNQAALTLKLIENAQRKEHLLRSEKLAAAGLLIQGMTGELRAPLGSIAALAARLTDQGLPGARAIVNESLRASAILSRLSVAAPDEQEEAQTLDVNQAVARALEACRSEWEEVDLSLDVEFHPKPLWVLGSPGQIYHVLRNLISLAARTAVETRDPAVTLSCGAMARRVAVTIEYPVAASSENFPLPSRADDDGGPLGFEVCRGILQGNGGDLEVNGARQGYCRVEISLPEAFQAVPRASLATGTRRPSGRPLTALLLEPDLAVQKRLVSLWTGSGHRAMPVANEAEALELAGRLRIDAVFCAVRVGATNWVEIFEQVRQRVAAFVLLTEGVESDENALFPEGEGLVLRKPVDAGDLSRLADRIEERLHAGLSVAP